MIRPSASGQGADRNAGQNERTLTRESLRLLSVLRATRGRSSSALSSGGQGRSDERPRRSRNSTNTRRRSSLCCSTCSRSTRTGCDHGGVLIAPVPTPEDIESLTFEVLETGRVGDAQQMAGAKDGFAVAKRIGGMNVAFDHLIVHQAIDHVGALAIRCAEHQRVPKRIAFVAKGVDADALFLANVFEGVVGVER